MAAHIRRLIITTGDADGIGTEVAAKALAKLPKQKNIQFVILRSPQTPPAHIRLLKKKYKLATFSSLDSALASEDLNPNLLLDVVTEQSPHDWVRDAATACVTGRASAIATAPMSKKSIGGRTIGHTEILKDVSKAPHVYMAFLGKHFNVVTCTGHIALKDVSTQLSADKIIRASLLVHDFTENLPKKQSRLPIALVGLNPHAGESGSIGHEESTIYSPVRRELESRKIAFDGPLVPDVAFVKTNWKKYSFYISPYHDQALIPFKLVHGQSSGAHMTLGLPFIRTSVDHGTAKDIFNTNKADPGSMLDALKWAILLSTSPSSNSKELK